MSISTPYPALASVHRLHDARPGSQAQENTSLVIRRGSTCRWRPPTFCAHDWSGAYVFPAISTADVPGAPGSAGARVGHARDPHPPSVLVMAAPPSRTLGFILLARDLPGTVRVWFMSALCLPLRTCREEPGKVAIPRFHQARLPSTTLGFPRHLTFRAPRG
jgi:hypothetical protein